MIFFNGVNLKTGARSVRVEIILVSGGKINLETWEYFFTSPSNIFFYKVEKKKIVLTVMMLEVPKIIFLIFFPFLTAFHRYFFQFFDNKSKILEEENFYLQNSRRVKGYYSQ